MSAAEWVVFEVEPNTAVLARRQDEGGLCYRRIASGPSSLVLEGIAETLNKEAELEAKAEAEEARETQLDAMVIHHETARHPELHADARPDSYGRTGEPAEDRARAVSDSIARGRVPIARPIGFRPSDRDTFRNPPPDGTVPGR